VQIVSAKVPTVFLILPPKNIFNVLNITHKQCDIPFIKQKLITLCIRVSIITQNVDVIIKVLQAAIFKHIHKL
jgi:hypothetical protein